STDEEPPADPTTRTSGVARRRRIRSVASSRDGYDDSRSSRVPSMAGRSESPTVWPNSTSGGWSPQLRSTTTSRPRTTRTMPTPYSGSATAGHNRNQTSRSPAGYAPTCKRSPPETTPPALPIPQPRANDPQSTKLPQRLAAEEGLLQPPGRRAGPGEILAPGIRGRRPRLRPGLHRRAASGAKPTS